MSTILHQFEFPELSVTLSPAAKVKLQVAVTSHIQYCLNTAQHMWRKRALEAEDAASRLRYPDTTGQ